MMKILAIEGSLEVKHRTYGKLPQVLPRGVHSSQPLSSHWLPILQTSATAGVAILLVTTVNSWIYLELTMVHHYLIANSHT